MMADMKLMVTMNDGTLAGRTYELESGFLTVGRGDNCSIRFDPMSERIASKQHAFIEAKVDGYYVTDNQSTNGTLVNGNRITEVIKLHSGDAIQFGRNGATATVQIDSQSPSGQYVPEISTKEEFRGYQVEKFNQAVQASPESLSTSVSSIGLGNIQSQISKPEEKGSGKKYIFATIAILAIVFLSLVVGLLLSSALSGVDKSGHMQLTLTGIAVAFGASFIAFIPALFYVLPLIWLDRYDPEPAWLLALAFAWGALVAVIVSFIVNTGIGYAAFRLTKDPEIANIVSGVISAPIFEEGSKGIGVLILLIFFRRYFDDILDGIIFAGVIALGFATVENVLYYGTAIAAAPAGLVAPSLILSFVMRGILSPFAHVTFTSMTGIGCGISRESHNKFIKVIMPVVGYGCAVFLHAFWNGMAFLGGFAGFILGYFILEVPFFLIFVGFTFYIMYRQNKILKEMLAIDIARGLIPEEHGKIATSAFKSSFWVLGGIFAGKFRARSNYVRAMGKLGLSYWHIQRATRAQGQTASFQQNPLLREEVLKWRDRV